MQEKVTTPESSYSESYGPFEFTQFLQDNWLYIILLIIAIVLVIKYSRRSKKKNSEE